MAAQLAQVETTIFQVCVQIKNVKRRKIHNRQQDMLLKPEEFLSRNTIVVLNVVE
jgi:hypothetical protein